MARFARIAVAAIALAACGKRQEAAEALTGKIAHAGPLTGSISHQGKDDENGVRLAIEPIPMISGSGASSPSRR